MVSTSALPADVTMTSSLETMGELHPPSWYRHLQNPLPDAFQLSSRRGSSTITPFEPLNCGPALGGLPLGRSGMAKKHLRC